MTLWEKKEPDKDRYSINENRLFYAWNWFSFHAGQRTTVFNFFLVAIGFILAAYARFVDKEPLLSACVAFIGIVVSLIFLGLDVRNRVLTHMGEAVLRRLEAEFLFKDQALSDSYLDKDMVPQPNTAGFLIREGSDEGGFFKGLKHPIQNRYNLLKHRYLIQLTYWIFAVVFTLALLYSLVPLCLCG